MATSFFERMSWHLARQISYDGFTQRAMAIKAGISEKHMSQLCTGRARLSVEVAVRLEEAMEGTLTADLLLSLQVQDELEEYRATHPRLKPEQQPNPDKL